MTTGNAKGTYQNCSSKASPVVDFPLGALKTRLATAGGTNDDATDELSAGEEEKWERFCEVKTRWYSVRCEGAGKCSYLSRRCQKLPLKPWQCVVQVFRLSSTRSVGAAEALAIRVFGTRS